jgi:GDP-L-fucose synthase
MIATDLHGRISVIGRETMLGAALLRRLAGGGTTRERSDLIASDPAFNDPVAVDAFFEQHRPDYVFVAAGRTAGIAGNQQYPADLMVDNMMIATHVIPAAWRSRVKKLLYLASSCTYPKLATQPLQISSLWAGTLEPTSAAYAAAKLAGMKLCEALRQQHGAPFISAIGADVYGPGDDFTLDNSHVVGALMRRMHDARIAQQPSVDVWGSGTPRREFIYVDDLADACVFAMQHYDGTDPINLGVGRACSIADLATTIAGVVGYGGELRFDRTRPDGAPVKLLDSHVLHELGWRPSWDLRRGLERTYDWFVTHRAVLSH